MYSTGTNPQIFAVVGSTYISERHSDEAQRYLSSLESSSLIDFEELLQTLRRALLCCGRAGR